MREFDRYIAQRWGTSLGARQGLMTPPAHEPPQTLSQLLAGQGECPIPFTHDRLNETHHWWHEMAVYYHEPEPFRYSFGAWIQAARSVTFMLQKERQAFDDFSWYGRWVERAKQLPELPWLQGKRTAIVHQEALQPGSWVELRCVRKKDDPYYDPGHDTDTYRISPFECTHSFMNVGHESMEDRHQHIAVRHWEVDDLPGREVLEFSADIFAELRQLVATAHLQAGSRLAQDAQDTEPAIEIAGRPPCMENVQQHQVARFRTRNGKTVWTNEPVEVRARRRRKPHG